MYHHQSLISCQIKPIIMKSIILVALALVAVAIAAPAENVEYPKIVRSSFDKAPEGSYNFKYETEDGVNREETGVLKEVLDEENKPHSVVIVRGTYSYPDKDGKSIVVSYTADENGYVAEGDSIPKAVRR